MSSIFFVSNMSVVIVLLPHSNVSVGIAFSLFELLKQARMGNDCQVNQLPVCVGIDLYELKQYFSNVELSSSPFVLLLFND